MFLFSLVWLLMADAISAQQTFATCTSLVSVNALSDALSLSDLTAVTTLLTTVGGVVKILGGTTLPNGPQCNTLCSAPDASHPDGYRYSVWAQGLDITASPIVVLPQATGTCVCTDTEPAANMNSPGSNPTGTCADVGGSVAQLHDGIVSGIPLVDSLGLHTTVVNLLKTLGLGSPVGIVGATVTYLYPNKASFQGCASLTTVTGTTLSATSFDNCGSICQAQGATRFAIAPGHQNTAATCIALNTGLALVPSINIPVPVSVPQILGNGNPLYNCICNPGGSATPANCNLPYYSNQCQTGVISVTAGVPADYAWNVYGITPQSTGVWRRRQLARLASKDVSPCPRSLTACNVASGQPGDFECLDIKSELESCGGCVNGFYSALGNSTQATGVDCTALNAALGGVSCVQGQCQVTSCLHGFVDINGECLKQT